MDDDRISKPEDQLIRNWIKRIYGVKVPQYDLWNLTPEQAARQLKSLSPALAGITKDDIEKAARRELQKGNKS